MESYNHERCRASRNNRLVPPVNGRPDHTLGGPNDPVTRVEYGSYNCPYYRAADEIIAGLRDRFGDRLRHVVRHRPISGDAVARRGAELAQYAYETTDEYWPGHAALMKRGPTLRPEDFDEVAAESASRESMASTEKRGALRRLECRRTSTAPGATGCRGIFINNRRYERP